MIAAHHNRVAIVEKLLEVRVSEVDFSCMLLIVPLIRCSSRFESHNRVAIVEKLLEVKFDNINVPPPRRARS